MSTLSENTIANMRKRPATVFESPRAVTADTRLSSTQKQEILESWAQECQQQLRADGEGMTLHDNASELMKAIENELVKLK